MINFNSKWVLSGLLMAGVLTVMSCDKSTTMSYTMRNAATDTITVVVMKGNDTANIDTVWIGYNQTATVGMINEGRDHISRYKENTAELRDFSIMSVYKSGMVPSVTNFLKTEKWTYKEHNTHSGEYMTTVTASDF